MTAPGGVAILGGVRTPFARAQDVLAPLSAADLGTLALGEALARTELAPALVDEVVAGNAAGPHDAPNLGRVIALRAGLPEAVPAVTVHRNCASGFEAIAAAARRIRLGEARVVAVVGVESMSAIPLLYPAAMKDRLLTFRRAKSAPAKLAALLRLRPRDFAPIVALEAGLTDPVCGLNMGETAENLAREFGISREAQDAFALESHRRATAAWEAGRLGEEVVPVVTPEPEGRLVPRDVGFRARQSLEALAKLRPVFDRRDGTVTAGNACQITDGAVALIVADGEWVRAEGRVPLGWLAGSAFAGLDPARMGLGPVFAAHRLLEQTGRRWESIDLIEINEAFAAQVIACQRAFASRTFAEQELGRPALVGEVDPERLNVNGGAIALGHPIGATGTRLVLTLLHEMRRREKRTGLAALCVGGGQGGALLLEQ